MKKNPQKPKLIPATKKEKFAELVAVAASAAPWIGGPVSQIIGSAATELKIARVTQFIKDVLDHAEALHTKATEEFAKSEDFIDILEKTAQAVADERIEKKRTLFANYILNNISHPDIVYDQRLAILRLLIELDTRHIDLLNVLLQHPTAQEQNMSISAPITTIERRAPQLHNDINDLIHKTNTMGLTNIQDNYLKLNMTGGGAANLEHVITPLGKRLLTLILEVE